MTDSMINQRLRDARLKLSLLMEQAIALPDGSPERAQVADELETYAEKVKELIKLKMTEATLFEKACFYGGSTLGWLLQWPFKFYLWFRKLMRAVEGE